jgi:hypothetical protein
MSTEIKPTAKNEAGAVTQYRKTKKRGQVFRGQFSTRGMGHRDTVHILTPSKTKYLSDIAGLPLFGFLKPTTPYKLSILESTILDHLILRANEFEDRRPGETDCYIGLDVLYEAITPDNERRGILATYTHLPPETKKEIKRRIKDAINGIRDKIKVGDITLEDDERVIILGCGFEYGKDRLVVHLHTEFARLLKERQIVTFLAHDTGHFDEYHRVEHKIYRYLQDDANKNQEAGGREHLVLGTVLDHVIDIVKENDLGNDRHTARRIIKRLIDALEYLTGQGGKGKKQPPHRIAYALHLDSLHGKQITPAEARTLPLNRIKELRFPYRLLNTDAPTKEILLERQAAKDAERRKEYETAYIEDHKEKKKTATQKTKAAQKTAHTKPKPDTTPSGARIVEGFPEPTETAATT